MNRREYALGKNIKGFELGLVGTVFVVAFSGGMVLPFYVYLFGAGVFWEYIGIMICMIAVWNFASYKLMRYSRKYMNIYSLPSYLKYRFKDEREYLRIIASSEIVILSIVIMSLLTKELGIILNEIFGLDSTFAAFFLCIIIATYLSIFGFNIIAKTAPYKAVFILAVVMTICMLTFNKMGIHTMIQNMMAMNVTGSVSNYMNVLIHNGRLLVPEDYVSLISMGLLASGMPFLLSTFFSAENSDRINVGKVVMIVFLPFFFASAAIMGGISRGYLYPQKLTNSLSKYIAIFYNKLFTDFGMNGLIGYLFLAVIILAVVITYEGSLHIIVTIIYDDIIRGGRLLRVKRKREGLYIAVITFMVTLICFIVSEFLDGFSVNVVVVFIGALGCSIAPTVFVSLAWRRMNKYGAVVGLISGLLAVPFFKYATFIGVRGDKRSLCDVMGVNSVVPSMLVAFLMIILVSLVTKKPSEKAVEEYDDIKHRIMN